MLVSAKLHFLTSEPRQMQYQRDIYGGKGCIFKWSHRCVFDVSNVAKQNAWPFDPVTGIDGSYFYKNIYSSYSMDVFL